MAKIAPPTEKKTPVKRIVKKTGEIKSNKATGQTPPDTIIPLQIKIPETVKNEFKAMASVRGQSMNVLLVSRKVKAFAF